MKKMNIPDSEHFNTKDGRQGAPKRAFNTKRDAELFLDSIENGSDFNIYQCSKCGKWHIGHCY